jgi:hypothetical protein
MDVNEASATAALFPRGSEEHGARTSASLLAGEPSQRISPVRAIGAVDFDGRRAARRAAAISIAARLAGARMTYAIPDTGALPQGDERCGTAKRSPQARGRTAD